MPMSLFYAFLVALVVLELIHQLTVHKLVNKLMSRNYHEYQVSEAAARSAVQGPPKVSVDDSPDEELGHLSGIG